MIIVLLADGFEEIEALTPVDMLRREGFDVKIVGVHGSVATSSHGVPVLADITADEVCLDEVDMLILPGGMPGMTNLDAAKFTHDAIDKVLERGGRIAAICAAPTILGRRGLLENCIATCHPDFKNELRAGKYLDTETVTCRNITTAKDMESSREFALEIIYQLKEDAKAREEKEKATPPLFSTGDFADFKLPSVDCLAPLTNPESAEVEREIQSNADRILELFDEFKIAASVSCAVRGPRFTRYEIIPERGTKVMKILGMCDDISLALAQGPVRIIAPIPGKSAVGIEVPNKTEGAVSLRELIESEEFASMKSKVSVCIGRDVCGAPVVTDIAKMPHLLICASREEEITNSVGCMLVSMLYKATPDELKLLIIDPSDKKYRPYETLPHILTPVISDVKRAAAALEFAVREMNKRYELLTALSVRNIDAYNEKVEGDPALGRKLFKLVIVVDEYSALMHGSVGAKVEENIVRLAQKARAAGIHIIITTSNLTGKCVSGMIKANVPTRFAFKLESGIHSRLALDCTGAEKLLLGGDMLMSTPGTMTPERIQHARITEDEILAVCNEISHTSSFCEAAVSSIDAIAEEMFKKRTAKKKRANDGYFSDDIFLKAISYTIIERKVSETLLAKWFGVTAETAKRYMKAMFTLGIIEQPEDGEGCALITPEEWRAKTALLCTDIDD